MLQFGVSCLLLLLFYTVDSLSFLRVDPVLVFNFTCEDVPSSTSTPIASYFPMYTFPSRKNYTSSPYLLVQYNQDYFSRMLPVYEDMIHDLELLDKSPMMPIPIHIPFPQIAVHAVLYMSSLHELRDANELLQVIRFLDFVGCDSSHDYPQYVLSIMRKQFRHNLARNLPLPFDPTSLPASLVHYILSSFDTELLFQIMNRMEGCCQVRLGHHFFSHDVFQIYENDLDTFAETLLHSPLRSFIETKTPIFLAPFEYLPFLTKMKFFSIKVDFIAKVFKHSDMIQLVQALKPVQRVSSSQQRLDDGTWITRSSTVTLSSRIVSMDFDYSISSDDSIYPLAMMLPTSTVEELILNGVNIGNKEIKILAQCIKNSNLKRLSLKYNIFTEDVVLELLEGLVDSSVQYLSLDRWVPFDSASFSRLASLLPVLPLHGLELYSIYSFHPGTFRALLSNPNLKELRLKKCRSIDIHEFLSSLKMAPHLNVFESTQTLVGSDFSLFLQILPTLSLTSLTLGDSLLPKMDGFHLLPLQKMSSLRELKLSHVHFHGQFRTFVQSFLNSTIQKLTIQNLFPSHQNDDHLSFLFDILHLTSLREFHIENVYDTTSPSLLPFIAPILPTLPQLRTLTIAQGNTTLRDLNLLFYYLPSTFLRHLSLSFELASIEDRFSFLSLLRMLSLSSLTDLTITYVSPLAFLESEVAQIKKIGDEMGIKIHIRGKFLF